MVVTFSWDYLHVDSCADAHISGDSGSSFGMHSGVTVVDGLRNVMPRSLWMIVEQSEGNKLRMVRVHQDLFRSRLMDRQPLGGEQNA